MKTRLLHLLNSEEHPAYTEVGVPMAELDIKALEANFESWRQERAPNLAPPIAFELYAINLILKDADLSDDEIESGHVGGANDGGIDGIYFFVNRQLIQEDSVLPPAIFAAELWIIQAKGETGFAENVITKFEAFAKDMFDFSKNIDPLTYYSEAVKDAIKSFRNQYEKMLGQPHKFSVKFAYATKSDQGPNTSVSQRAIQLKNTVLQLFTAATVDVQFWCARDLTNAWRHPANMTLSLDIVANMMAGDGSMVCLARLDRFAKFLTNDATTPETLRQYLLEPNVRDYQGARNPVNTDIRGTLADSASKEFWWLNNGVTIVADTCSLMGGPKIQIENPEIVNGLQTSHEIYNSFEGNKRDDGRMILVRVLLPKDELTRSAIIKATNNQTAVEPLSLRATEGIHFDIEELLKLYQIWYDRRKGEYRRKKKPISDIVSIKEMAQVVMAIALQRPNDARARPLSVLKSEQGYKEIFDVNAPRDLYLVCILIDRQVNKFLVGKGSPRDFIADVRYYMDMWLGCILSKKLNPSRAELAALASIVKSPLAEQLLEQSATSVNKAYAETGYSSKAAKGPEMIQKLLPIIQGDLNAA